MERLQKSKVNRLRKKYDGVVEEIFRTAVQWRANIVHIFQTSNKINIKMALKSGRDKWLKKYPSSNYSGLIDRIKYMANLPLRKLNLKQRSMIQVNLDLPEGEKIMAFYVETKIDKPRYKQYLILAPIWVSLSNA